MESTAEDLLQGKIYIISPYTLTNLTETKLIQINRTNIVFLYRLTYKILGLPYEITNQHRNSYTISKIFKMKCIMYKLNESTNKNYLYSKLLLEFN